MQTQNGTRAWYVSQFEILERSLNGEAASPLHRMRKDAIERFQSIGFPTTKDEEWRFTNVAPIARLELRPVLEDPGASLSEAELRRVLPADPDAVCLVFMNDHYSAAHSRVRALPSGVRAGSLMAAVRSDASVVEALVQRRRADEDAFVSLNSAFMKDGAFVSVADGVAMRSALHLVFLSGHEAPPFLSQPRNLILAGKHSRLSVVEHHVGLSAEAHLTNVVTDIVVGDGADVEHDSLQEEDGRAYHVASTRIALGGNSRFTSNAVSFGSLLTRNTITAVFGAEGSECTLNGLILATGNQHVDTHSVIDHASPHCASHELYKAILDGHARGVFNGKIFVRKDAQKTDAKQTNKTLLLSDDAMINAKPQLEIFADDVKCTHGATVGQLDEEQLFYLRTRGIDLESARDLLTHAFASDVIERINDEVVRKELAGLLRAKLKLGRIAREEP